MCVMFSRSPLFLGLNVVAAAGADTADKNTILLSLFLTHLPLWAAIAVAAFLLQFTFLLGAVIYLGNRLHGGGRGAGSSSSSSGDKLAGAKKGKAFVVARRRSVASSKDETLLLTAMDVLYLQHRKEMAEAEDQERFWPEHRLGTGAAAESTVDELPVTSATGLSNSSYDNFSAVAEVHV